MAAAKMRITPDAELATEGAIRFRLDQLAKEIPTPAIARRIAALKLRLPQEAGKPILPAVNAALLVSKKDLE